MERVRYGVMCGRYKRVPPWLLNANMSYSSMAGSRRSVAITISLDLITLYCRIDSVDTLLIVPLLAAGASYVRLV